MALQRGSTGDDVKALQQQLNAAGYNLDADGVFGAKTQAAVKDYQTKNGLSVDGIVGSQTNAALAGLTATNNTTAAIQSTPAPAAKPASSTSSYTPVDTSGRDYATEYGMSAEDKKNIEDLRTAYNNASDQATRDALHAAGEAIRAQYGYSGGSDGTAGIAKETPSSAAANAAINQIKAENQQSMQAQQNKIDEQQQMIEELKNLYSNQYTAALAEKESAYNAALAEQQKLFDQQKNAYEQALAEQKAAKQAAVDQAVGRLSLQRDNTKTSYADMFRQLYLNRMNNEKNLNQRLAATGQTGGQAESTMLGLATEYENALRQGGVAEQQALSQLDQAMVDAQLPGDISSAEYAADLAQKQTDNYAQVLQNLINRNDTINQQAASIQASQDAANRNYAYQTAMAILQSGSMATDDLLNAAGISKADAATIVATAAAQKKAASTAATSPKKATELQAQLAWSAIQNGQDTAENRAILESYYGMPYSTILVANGGKVPASQNISVDEYSEQAGNYIQARDTAQKVFDSSGKQQALNFIKDAYAEKLLTFNDYTRLYNHFRDL